MRETGRLSRARRPPPVARAARQPYRFRSDAELLLKGSAWRGDGASAIGLRADAPAGGGLFAAALPWPS
jgi:hypothetical protein